ncbi:hypothetical protein F4Z99_09490 [Candidatus Poribacteria bacterium]|nr:hypothetical protein [Candidatus Poribacteria bacterium]MYB01462.1 hypothetical protein [Candidatus Poribacteria bacterium]
MKLGTYAKEREKRVIEYLHNNCCQTRDDIQSALFKQAPIDVTHELADLQKMGLVEASRPCNKEKHVFRLTKKARKWIKKGKLKI